MIQSKHTSNRLTAPSGHYFERGGICTECAAGSAGHCEVFARLQKDLQKDGENVIEATNEQMVAAANRVEIRTPRDVADPCPLHLERML